MKTRDKRFLTDDYSENGRISWHVENEETRSNYLSEFNQIVSAELTIADCYKTITLDFDCENLKDLDKRIKKVNNLLSSIKAFKDALEEIRAEELNKFKFYY